MKKKKVNYNGKLLYFRRNNEEGHTNVVIIGDENKLGGRDLAYTHKGERKNAIKKAFIISVDGVEDLNWPRVFEDIKLTDNVSRDYSVHEYIKNECYDICTWDGEADEGEYNTREAFIVNGKEEDGSLEKNIYEEHPLTKSPLLWLTIPKWPRTKRLVSRIKDTIPDNKYLQIDIVMTSDGPSLKDISTCPNYQEFQLLSLLNHQKLIKDIFN